MIVNRTIVMYVTLLGTQHTYIGEVKLTIDEAMKHQYLKYKFIDSNRKQKINNDSQWDYHYILHSQPSILLRRCKENNE